MYISRVIISNYRCLKTADVTLNSDLNTIVGDNESGKSTLLEAIHLALTGQLNGRPIKLNFTRICSTPRPWLITLPPS